MHQSHKKLRGLKPVDSGVHKPWNAEVLQLWLGTHSRFAGKRSRAYMALDPQAFRALRYIKSDPKP